MDGARVRIRKSTPMGVSSPDARTASVVCRGPACDTYGPRADFIEGDYCSNYCATRADGIEYLSDIKHDHRLCFTCGRTLKEVYRPTDKGRGIGRRGKGIEKDGIDFSKYVAHWPPSEGFIGWQTTTPHAAYGERDFGPVVGTGVVCRCGNTDHREHATELVTREGLRRLCERIDAAHDDASVDTEAVVERAVETGDLALAVGEGVEG